MSTCCDGICVGTANRTAAGRESGTHRLMESALESEITDHLGYDRRDPAGRNGEQPGLVGSPLVFRGVCGAVGQQHALVEVAVLAVARRHRLACRAPG
jgi:hypothetical protein